MEINRFELTGFVGNDAEAGATNGGTPTTAFSLYVTRRWNNADGVQQEQKDRFSIEGYGQVAEAANGNLFKGVRVNVIGRIEQQSWDDRESGEKRYRTAFIMTRFVILSSRTSPTETADDSAEEVQDGVASIMTRTEDLPF